MDENSELAILERVCKGAKQEDKLTGKNMHILHETFGNRFTKALEALQEDRVKRYTFKPSGKVVWIVVGKKRDYLLMPEARFCTCDDFYFRVLDREIHLCYHLIAQKIAKSLKWHDAIEENDEIYESLMEEWKKPTP